MILIVKAALLLSAGIFVAVLVKYLIDKISARSIKNDTSVKTGFPTEFTPERFLSGGNDGQIKSAGFRLKPFKEYQKILAENPNSKVSRKIRLTVASAGFLAVLVIVGKIIFALLCAGGIFMAIGWHFNKQIKKNKDKFDDQLIEALGMIKNSVRAGQSLVQAFENMVKDTKPPVSTEFEEVLRQTRLGTPIEQALIDMTKHLNSKDLKIAVTSINLAKETGGNLGEILTRLSDTMRERKKIQGKIVTLTAQGKASGMVMSAVPFLLLVVLYLMEPGMMGLLFTTFLGNIMLAIAIAMISAGAILINKIVSIDI